MKKAKNKIWSKEKPYVKALSELRAAALVFVNQHEFLPITVKDLAQDAVRRHFAALSQELGALELAVRRTENRR